MKLLPLLLFPILLACGSASESRQTPGKNLEPFCGTSTEAACRSDADCARSGCSRQVCQGSAEEPRVTTCEFRECYQAERYGLDCGCAEGKCRWH